MRTRPLREAPPRELRPLLDEEAAHWDAELGWDFAEVRGRGRGGDRAGHACPAAWCVDGVRARRLLLLHGRRRAR